MCSGLEQYILISTALVFLLMLIVTWVVFSLILVWFRPQFTNEDGTLNWWNSLWVAASTIGFTYIIMTILFFLFFIIAIKTRIGFSLLMLLDGGRCLL